MFVLHIKYVWHRQGRGHGATPPIHPEKLKRKLTDALCLISAVESTNYTKITIMHR